MRDNPATLAFKQACSDPGPAPGYTHLRGIVICAGGPKYFPCAWVLINRLRELGCGLPIELWHLGEKEMPEEHRALVEPLGVRCVDGRVMTSWFPARRLGGWELKPYAIAHSRFREVLLLDADNVPVHNPEYLFDDPHFKNTRAVFWPDYGRLARSRTIWKLTGVPYVNEPEFESGQVLVDKVDRWPALAATLAMNDHSDFWYRHIHGDKETFHMAWRATRSPFAMPAFPIQKLPKFGPSVVMCQHDGSGRVIFQHRNMDKWKLEGNRRIEGFVDEDRCLKLLGELREKLGVKTQEPVVQSPPPPPEAPPVYEGLFRYRNPGSEASTRTVRLDHNGLISEGATAHENHWQRERVGTTDYLVLNGATGPTVKLTWSDGAWHGRWLRYSKLFVELAPIAENTTNA